MASTVVDSASIIGTDSSNSNSAVVSWKKSIYDQVVARNRTQDKFYRDLISSYEALLNEDRDLKEANVSLNKELSELRKTEKNLLEENAALKSNGTMGVITSAKVKELEEKIYKLQEELTSSYRVKAEVAQSMVELTQELKQTEKDLKDTKRKLEETTEEKNALLEKRDELEKEIEKKDGIISVLEGEVGAIKAELAANEEKMKKMETENKQMLERFLQQKQREVDAMNQVAELYEALTKMKEELEAYKSGSFAAANNAVITEGKLDTSEALSVGPPKEQFRSFSAHDADINSIAFNKGGNLFATGSNDKTVKLWDARTGNLSATLHGSVQGVISVDFSPSSEYVLGTCNDSSVRIWTVAQQRLRHTLTGHTNKVYAAAFSSDSKKVVTGSHDRTLKFWDLMKGSCIKTSICFSSCNDVDVDADFVVSGHFDGAIRFWDMRTGNMTEDIAGAHTNQITSVCISPDTTTVLTNSKDNTLKLYDIRKLQELATFKHVDYKNMISYNRACFSPDGAYIAVGSSHGQVLVWNTRTLTFESMLKGHKNSVTCCSWNIDGSLLASVGLDKQIIFYK